MKTYCVRIGSRSIGIAALLSFLLSYAGLKAAENNLLQDEKVYQIEISLAGDSYWLGVERGKAAPRLSKHSYEAANWRIHDKGNQHYLIEALVEGKRWLMVNGSGQVVFAGSDSALSSLWHLDHQQAASYTARNSQWQQLNHKLAFGSGQTALSASDSFVMNFHPQISSPSPFRHGDIISLRSLAADSGRVWLDGNTNNGNVGLAPDTAFSSFSGTHWRVHDNQDGSYSLESLGRSYGRRWLRVYQENPNLGSTTDRGQASRWQVISGPNGSIALKNTSKDARFTWLNSHPSSGILTLAAEPSSSNPGIYWQVKIQRQADYRREGRWSAVEPMPVSGIHTHVLPNGKVLFWSRFFEAADYDSTLEGVPIGGPSTFLLDPITLELQTLANSPVDSFCSGHSFLPDGRLLVTGGHITSFVGPKATQIFDYRTNSWEHRPEWDMNRGRWYPTNVTLASGDILTVSGDADGEGDANRIPQVWSAQNHSWRDLNNLASSCFNENNRGPCMPLYPWLHLAPNGKVFVSGPGQLTGYIDTEGEGEWLPVAETHQGYRGDYEASSIMYRPGKIMIAGGLPVTNSVETIDLNAEQPQWKQVESLRHARHKLMSTILADGQVLVLGGTASDRVQDDFSVFATEIWNPDTGHWTQGDHMLVPRLYHSTAVLLVDGRVLTAGGGLGAGFTTHKNFQIYSPPYLFQGDRPEIKYAPAQIQYGQEFFVSSDEAQSISKAHLIRLSSDTHSFNSSQMFVPLNFTIENDQRIKSVAPVRREIAPPGHYILFIVNEQGVPSVGQVVQLLDAK